MQGEWKQEGHTPSGLEEPISHVRPATGRFRIGRYRPVRQVASGGFGTVYAAAAEGPGGFQKLVALKRLHPHLAQKEGFVEMFLDEARIAACISHPNVCGTLDFGEEDGELYLAMEFVHGLSLSKLKTGLKRTPLGSPQKQVAMLAWVAAEAAAGLHAAHQATDAMGQPLQVVHRDVSPGNLFLTWRGHVKVLDFGIAKAASRIHSTRTGTVKGSIRYLSPEQATGGSIDARSDVWSLGVVLWECLTDQRLFPRAGLAETLHAINDIEIKPPSAYRPEVPPELDAVVLRALQRRPADRYASAAEMERDLREWLATTGITMWSQLLADALDSLFPGGKQAQAKWLQEALEAAGPSPFAHESTGSRSIPQVPAPPDEDPTVFDDAIAARIAATDESVTAMPTRKPLHPAWLLALAVAVGAATSAITAWLLG